MAKKKARIKFDFKELVLRLLARFKKPIIIFIAVIAAIFIIKTTFFILFSNSKNFNIRTITVNGQANKELFNDLKSGLLNKNIFKVEFGALRRSILGANPQIYQISFSRAFPNKVVVYIANRRPIAQIKYGNNYLLISKEGIVIYNIGANPMPGLPEILVSDFGPKDLRVGAKKVSRCLIQINYFLNAARSIGFLGRHKVSLIDARDIKNVAFVMEHDVEIRIGDTEFKDRLRGLERILYEQNIDLKTIKYIDLRFADIIIGPR